MFPLLFILSGCSDDFFIDELTDNQLEIWTDPLPKGRVGEPYEAILGAEVKNTPFDNRFDMSFRIIDSELPPGIEFSEEEIRGQTRAVLRGVPTEAGTTVFVLEAFSRKLESEQIREKEFERDQGDVLISTATKARDEEIFTLHILE